MAEYYIQLRGNYKVVPVLVGRKWLHISIKYSKHVENCINQLIITNPVYIYHGKYNNNK